MVVGGGVVGLAVALALRRRQAEVVLLERSADCGQAASAAAAGMLAVGAEATEPGPFMELCRRSREMWSGWSEELLALSQVDCELELCGLLRVASTEAGQLELARQRQRHLQEGVRVSALLDRGQLLGVLPGLWEQVQAGLNYPDDGHVHSHRVVEALLQACRRLGVEIRTGAEARSLRAAPGGVSVELAQGGRLEGDAALVCAGAWSSALLPDLPQFGMEPVRGQMLACEPGRELLPTILFGEEGYLLQKRSGLLLAGSTEERAGFAPWPTMAGVARLAEVAGRLLPDLAGVRFAGAWAGLRPRARAGLLAGRLDPDGKVLVATGHFRNGILLAPVTGELLARAAFADEDPEELRPFSPRRPVPAES